MSKPTVSAPVMPQMLRDRSALLDVLAQGASNRDIVVFLQLISSPQTVFDANILSNITYRILKDLLCVFNLPSSYKGFLPSPDGQIYVSTFYHKSSGYC